VARLAWVVLTVTIAICATVAVIVHRAHDLTPRQRLLAADLDRLRGDDGLFTSTTELGGPGLYASAYGLTALAESGVDLRAKPVQVTRAAFGAQIAQDPLWGRFYLALLERTLHLRLHDESDVTALRRMRQADGSFLDPKAESGLDHDHGYRLSTTSAAVRALRVFGDPLTQDRALSAHWLGTAGLTNADSLSGRLQLLRADAALGVSRPSDLAGVLARWWAANRSKSAAGNNELVETCSFVLLAAESGSGLSADQRAGLRTMLMPTNTVPGDPQIAELLASALRALSTRPPAALIQIIDRHRLPGTGLLGEVQQHNGDLDASFQVQELRASAGLPMKDPRLARALLAHRHDLLDKASPGAGAVWLATLTSAGGTVGTGDANGLTEQARRQLLLPITAGQAQQWSELVAAMTMLDEPVPAPNLSDLSQIPTDRRRDIVDLVLPYLAERARQGLSHEPATATAGYGIQLLASGQVTQAAAALNAAVTSGWTASNTDRRRITELLRSRRGCPATSQLFSETGIPQCNISSSLGAWRLLRIAHA
jgi:hypothetical protein